MRYFKPGIFFIGSLFFAACGNNNPGDNKKAVVIDTVIEKPLNVPQFDADRADDGGSGVGVLLEMAREIKAHGLPTNIGIDILFTDVEDYGQTRWGEDSYCLGTQYWARHPHVPGYRADYGILLDMVGAHGAQF